MGGGWICVCGRAGWRGRGGWHFERGAGSYSHPAHPDRTLFLSSSSFTLSPPMCLLAPKLVEKRRLSLDHKQLAQMQIEEAQRGECTFQPNVNMKKGKRRSRGSPRQLGNVGNGRSSPSSQSYLNEQVE